MADPKEHDPKPNEPEDRGDEHIPTPDDDTPAPKDKDKDELSAEDLAAVAAEGQVPYTRFKEAERTAREERDARIALEAENRLLRERSTAPVPKAEPEPDLKALRKARNDKLLEGDSEGAAALEEQIDEIKERRLTASIAAQTRAEARNEVRTSELNKTAAAMVKQYPFLNSKSPDRNQEAIDETVEWRDFYIAKGVTPAEALEKAVERVVPAYTKGGEGEGEGEGDDLARIRSAHALSRGAVTARSQPVGPTGGKGSRATNEQPIKDVSTLSDAEFRKLPEAEKKRLRGD